MYGIVLNIDFKARKLMILGLNCFKRVIIE